MQEMPLQTKDCHKCGKSYSYRNSANMIVFCPHCHHSDIVCCDFGFGPVTPCSIDLGDKRVATLDTEEVDRQIRYRLVSEEYGIDRYLESSYMEAIGEAGRIISEKIDGI